MSKSRAKSESNIYHVMARGDGRQIVFENDEDRKLFLALLRNRKQQDAPIFAWCLMDNHFHLVIQASLPVLSLMMQQIMSQYASSFNMRHQHTGHVFNQRFKSEPINDDSYFLTVVRYVHQNPIKAGITKTCFYPWSSYGEYFDAPRITSTALILEMLGGIGAFQSFHDISSKEKVLDVDSVRPKTRSLPDEEAFNRAFRLYNRDLLRDLKGAERSERDSTIASLKEAGLTFRQIERLTGIGRGIIQDIKTH